MQATIGYMQSTIYAIAVIGLACFTPFDSQAHDLFSGLFNDRGAPQLQTDIGRISKVEAKRQGDKVLITVYGKRLPGRRGKAYPDHWLAEECRFDIDIWREDLTLSDAIDAYNSVQKNAGFFMNGISVNPDALPTTIEFRDINGRSVPKQGIWNVRIDVKQMGTIESDGILYMPHCHGAPKDSMNVSTKLLQERLGRGIRSIDDVPRIPKVDELGQPGNSRVSPRN